MALAQAHALAEAAALPAKPPEPATKVFSMTMTGQRASMSSIAVLAADVGQRSAELPSWRAERPAAAAEQHVGIEPSRRVLTVDVRATASPVKACTRSGAASARARKITGARYQPVRVRRLTAAGFRQLRIEPSGAFTVKAR